MHQHNLPNISSKVPDQLFERVDLLLTVGFLFGFILSKFGLQGFKLMLCVQVLGEESQEVSTKRILWLPYLKGISTDQPPKLFANYSQILVTSRGGIGGRVHHILIPETSIQDVKHKPIIFFSQILPLQF